MLGHVFWDELFILLRLRVYRERLSLCVRVCVCVFLALLVLGVDEGVNINGS